MIIHSAQKLSTTGACPKTSYTLN